MWAARTEFDTMPPVPSPLRKSPMGGVDAMA